MVRRPLPALAALLMLGLQLGCGRDEVPSAAPAPPRDVPVFIISIDTLRSDHLPAYGYGGVSTPAIDAFRKDAVLFAHAFSQCPQTLPAHASLLTGQVPPRHGVWDNIGYTLSSEATLPSILKAHRYSTGAAISSYVLRRATGIAAGFDFFDDSLDYADQLVKTSAERDGDESRLALERWIEQTDGKRIFGFLHLYEPHSPYAPPEPFRDIASPYDGEIAYADAIVGTFLDSLRRRGLYDDALIIILSDHGEGLGDHGEMEHGLFVYRESIQVPLLVKLPKGERAGTTVDRAVGLIDVLPTVLRIAGAWSPAPVDGVDLFEKAPAPRRIYSESYFPRLHFGWHELKALLDDRLHFIDAPKREVYAYRSDPGESTNLLEQERRAAFAMARDLEPFKEFKPPSAVDPEDQRKLAALGYIGSGGGTETLADPKDKIEVFRDIRQAFAMVLNGREGEAVPLLRSLVEREPNVPDAWWLLAQALRKTGQPAEAFRALQRGLAVFPTNTNLTLTSADLLYEMGKFDAAREHAELAMGRDAVLGGELLARAELKRGNTAVARRGAQAALNAAPERTETLMLLADIARAERKPAEELQYLERASRIVRTRNLAPIRSLEFHRGEALLAVGRVRESERAFRDETSRFADHRQAWSSLALVVGAQGRMEEARAILRQALERNRDARMLSLAVESLQTMSDPQGARELQRAYRQGQ